jgi:flavin-dependent dehydrogenase
VNLRDIENFLYESIKDKKKIKLRRNVVNFDLEQRTVKLFEGKEIGFNILVFATGVLGVKFRNALSVSHPRNVFCYAVEIKANDEITTVIDNNLAPGFYGWIIPLKEGIIEIGFGAEELNIRDHKEIRKRLYSLAHLGEYKNKKILRVNGGFIPTGMIEKKSNRN